MAINMASTFNENRLDSRNLLQVLTGVKRGDCSARLPDDWTGVDGKIADTVNDIIELMADGTAEIERVSRAVGKEGKLSQRAAVPVAKGAWKIRNGGCRHLPRANRSRRAASRMKAGACAKMARDFGLIW